MPLRPYRLAFYVDVRGDSPVERWLQQLDPVAAYALGSAMDGLLQQSGALLCVLRPQYASSLGGGLYEFRFQDLTEDLLRQLELDLPECPDPDRTKDDRKRKAPYQTPPDASSARLQNLVC